MYSMELPERLNERPRHPSKGMSDPALTIGPDHPWFDVFMAGEIDKIEVAPDESLAHDAVMIQARANAIALPLFRHLFKV